MSSKLYPIIQNGRFANYAGEKHRSFMIHSFFMLCQSWLKRRPHTMEQWRTPFKAISNSDIPHITWIGHSTFLIHIGSLTILTDPVFYDLSFLFPRITQPGVAPSLLPPIDVVIISHNHRDHMDEKSLVMLKKLNPSLKVLVPFGDKAWFDKQDFLDAQECMWWDEVILKKGVESFKFTFLPAYHWSQRTIFDRNKSLWGSWMLQSYNPLWNIYFAGDTAYSKHFSTIGAQFPQIDIALMPIGPCEPHAWMKFSHVNAEQAGQGFLELGARHFIPMHWGTFNFGIDHVFQPLERIQVWWQKNQLSFPHQLHCLKIGQTFLLEEKASVFQMPSGKEIEL